MEHENKKKEHFFCVVYFVHAWEERTDKHGNIRKVIASAKTAFYNKVDKPYKLAENLGNKWYWIKGYKSKQEYENNKTNYLFIFDKDNPVTQFNFKNFFKN